MRVLLELSHMQQLIVVMLSSFFRAIKACCLQTAVAAVAGLWTATMGWGIMYPWGVAGNPNPVSASVTSLSKWHL